MKNLEKSTINSLAVFIVVLSVTLTGCGEDFLERYPKDSPNPENFFVGETSARQAASATYNPWVSSSAMYGRDLMIIFDAMTDDSFWRPSRSESIQQESWDIFPDHDTIEDYWSNPYESINAANFAIEGIPTATDESFTEEQRAFYIAEARFMRGFSYLFLTTLFGDVPLIEKVLSDFSEYNKPRAPKEAVFELIISDFTYGVQNLPDEWPQDYSGRPTKATAAAFLAKAHLYNEDFESAETAARDAIDRAEDEGNELIDDYPSIFEQSNEGNPEILFAFQFVHNDPDHGQNATVQRNCRDVAAEFRTIYTDGWGYALPQRSLYDAFEPNDPRRGYTVMAPGDVYGIYNGDAPVEFEHEIYDEQQGEFVTYTKTYNPGDPVDYDYRWSPTGLNTRKMIADMSDLANVRWSGMDMPVMRMGELYLILAEALAEQDDSEALTWVNQVRSRASVDMPDRSVGDGEIGDGSLVEIVRHERRVELAMEGHRLLDIMRWETVDEVFGDGTKVKRHFYSDYLTDPATRFDSPDIVTPRHYLFPIPLDEMDDNDQINQNNPGY